MKVTVIILAKEEQATVGDVIRTAKNYVDEVIVVCDSSSDPTLSVARECGAKCMQNTLGSGKGRAVRYAIDHVESDILVLMDADGSHKAEDIPKLVEPIKRGEAAMVIASRIMKGAGSEELTTGFGEKLRLLANKISAFITSKIAGYDLEDVHNGFRAIRSDVAKRLNLKEPRFAIEPEMVIRCGKLGEKTIEVPTIELRRQAGVSRLNDWKQCVDCITCYLENII